MRYLLGFSFQFSGIITGASPFYRLHLGDAWLPDHGYHHVRRVGRLELPGQCLLLRNFPPKGEQHLEL